MPFACMLALNYAGLRIKRIKPMRMKLVLAATAALSLGATGIASANVVETGSIASTGAASYAGGLNVVMSQYDTLTLPTLNSLVLTITTNEAANVAVNNTSATDYSFTNGTASVNMILTGPGGLFQLLTTSATVASGTAFANSTTNFPGLTGTTTYTTTLSGASLAPFEGTGNFSLTFVGLTGSGAFSGTSSAPSNTLFFGGGANIGVDVTADFQNAPEPASLAVLGTAIAGIGIMRRRKRAA